MTRRYFGTDGIRGRVGVSPITADFAVRLGRAAGKVLSQQVESPKILIGKDPRSSGYMLEAALEAGLSAAGARAVLTGPIPTPAIAYLTQTQGAQAGIVISASHNPYHDNGIKFFSHLGEKLPDAVELEIEAELDRPFETVGPERLGKAERLDDARGRYVEFCKSTAAPAVRNLRGMKVLLDCANGATFKVAPLVFQELGFQVQAIACEPNGLNINAGCGATDLSFLRAQLAHSDAELGIAFDGDGDRLMLIERGGRVLDGDDVLYALACDWQRSGRLRGPVVGTVMTNFGIERALQQRGLGFKRAKVGDRYVHELLKAEGGILGGEASGHLLCLDRVSTGDAIVSALQALAIVAQSGQPLSHALGDLQRVPQLMINVPIAAGVKPLESAEVKAELAVVERELAARGRVVLRASGTEPLVRVTVEGEDANQVKHLAERLADVVRRAG